MHHFAEWKDARNYALKTTHESGLDMAIRRANKHDKPGFIVTYACRMDSDYARAEIVRPTDQI